jgi:hypothetical protein
MIGANVLNQVQLLCKTVRNSPRLFGGIQVILVGDFYQLKPVENELYGDSGKHCFVLPWFETYFPHKINLNIIHLPGTVIYDNYTHQLLNFEQIGEHLTPH